MKIYLSNSDYLRNFETFMDNIELGNPNELIISTHSKWVSVHPAILTIVAAFGSLMEPGQITVDPITAKSGHYLDRMGLFDSLKIESPYSITKHESAGRFIPVTQISTPDEQTRFITEMIPLLHLQPQQADAIKYMIGELVRNVLEHAESKHGAFVAAQYYHKSNMVRLGIADVGVGICATINRSWRANTNIDAIKLALTPGVTGTTRREGGNETNAGAGLFFIKSMAVVARDYFVIYSGTGLYKLTKRDRRLKQFPKLHSDPNRDEHAETSNALSFPGTVVAIDISLDQTIEFKSLLAAIREAYTEAVRERKKRKYKKPQFIQSN
jgi:anti-sigma regulatory factor (Ser/Thr protein kinase)